MKVCLVTICIGDNYLKQYNELFRPSQEHYALKCGYDFKVITDYISPPYHKDLISFNKILVCNFKWDKDYDFIIFIDADIIINNDAPSLHNFYDFGDKIGVVNHSQPDLLARLLCQKHRGYEVTASEYYKLKSNHDINTDHIINTGLLVFQPRKHSLFLQNIFEQYHKYQINNTNGFHYEQAVIGYEIQNSNLHFYMDMKWNALWANNKYYYNIIRKKNLTIREFYKNNYFTHLAGKCDYDLVNTLL